MPIPVDQIDTRFIPKLLAELIEYIKGLGFDQQQMSKYFNKYKNRRLTTPLISNLKNRIRDGFKQNDKLYFKLILERFEVKFNFENIDNFSFGGGVKNSEHPDENEKANQAKTFFETEKGNKWQIFVHIGGEIGIRYLKINSLENSEYIINTNVHDNFIGGGRFNSTGSFLIFDLKAAEGVKDLHIRFYIGNRTVKPEMLLGVLVHNVIEDNTIVCHNILALNISSSNTDENPIKIPFEEFKKTNKHIADYFDLRKSMIHSDGKILDISKLPQYISKLNLK